MINDLFKDGVGGSAIVTGLVEHLLQESAAVLIAAQI